jgi:hypothetical protein
VREEGAGHAVVPYYEPPAKPSCLDDVMDMEFTTKSVVQPGKIPAKRKGKKAAKKNQAKKGRASFKRPPPGRTEVKGFAKVRLLSSSWDDILLAGLPVAAYPQSESRGAKVYSVHSKSGIQHSNTF